MSTHSSKMRAALEYARRGIPLFPCKPSGKEPLTLNGFKDATTAQSRITAWWNAYPGANIGVPTGKRSGILALDVDHPAALDELEREHRALPETRTHATGSGGMHYLFSYPASENIRNSAGKLAPGLDVRGEGGYIIVPPSATTRPYEVLDDTALAEPPEWLLEALREPQRGFRGRTGSPTPGSVTTDLDGPPIPDRTRNVSLTSICGKLHDGTRDLAQLTADLLAIRDARCENPSTFPDDEVEKIARSILKLPPCNASAQATAEVLDELERFDAHVDGLDLHGTADYTMRDVLIAAARIFRRHGEIIPAGVRGEVSIRELAEEASIGSTKTVWKAINRARVRELARRDGTGSGPKRGALVLLTRAKGNTQPQRIYDRTEEKISVSSGAPPLSAPRLRWSAPGQRRLGKKKGRLIDLLEHAEGLALEEIAEVLSQRKPRDLIRRKQLTKITLPSGEEVYGEAGKGRDGELTQLMEAGVVECIEGKFRLTLDWRAALDKRRIEDGEIEAAEFQKRQHEQQSLRFREAWVRGEILSKEELARRRLNRDRIRPEERHVSGLVSELEREPNEERSPAVDGVKTDTKDADRLRRLAALAQERIAEPPRERPLLSHPERAALLLRRLRRDDPECFAALRSDPRALAWEVSGRGWTETIYCGNTIRSALEALDRELVTVGAVA